MTQTFTVGDRVRLAVRPPYFKTAEPLPMLRPSDLVLMGEEGIILEQRPGGYWAVKFERGSFLVDSTYLERAIQELPSEEASQ